MRPYEAHRPDDALLARLVTEDGLTDQEIADRYGVRRQTARYWRLTAGIHKDSPQRFDHSDMLPWRLTVGDSRDAIAARLRSYSRMRQGGDVSEKERHTVEKFVEFLQRERVVVDYDRTKGFLLRRRNPDLDTDSDIIRRPVGVQ